ncbi:ZIP family zinc transporter [Natranaerovirga hydrolytica]|uniref:ZIP family zinc transporter n=1 Tax=Natranaerovirga hydrolytica TaxID=680378 RepID=A0A4R1MMA2_9FIRM|nr:ZIP family metal transporter [Natranaerovirga hydrolytica]TCK92404.1 ZIP family zinc transporter [Natranaerovirga hydrolytica]
MANYALIIGFFSGLIGLTIGTTTAYSVTNRGNRCESMITGFTGGLMLSIIYIDILPEAFSQSGLKTTLIGMLIGIFFLQIVEYVVNLKLTRKVKNKLELGYKKTAFMIAIALALHNIPEGLAIGSLVSDNIYKGLKFGLVITMHNIPEGFIIASPFKKSNVPLRKIIYLSLGISFFMGISGYFGYILSSASKVFMSISLGMAGGIMLYVTCGEILMKSLEKWKGKSVILSVILGIIIGIIISY